MRVCVCVSCYGRHLVLGKVEIIGNDTILNVCFPLFLLVVLVFQTILVAAVVNLDLEYVDNCDR